MRRAFSAGVGLAAAVTVAVGSPAVAQSTWTGAANGQWGNANNWSPLGIPTGGIDQTLTFGAAANTAMTAGSGGTPFLLNRMTFSAGGPAYTVGGNPLDFRASSASALPFIVMDTDNAVTIGDPLTLTTLLTVGGTGAGALALNGVISGGGRLTYSGAGTVTLGGGSNTYTGGTLITSGTLAIGANGAAIPANTPVTVLPGGTFDLRLSTNSAANALSNLTLNGGTLKATGATNSDFYTKQLTMTGGAVNLADTPFTWIHVTGAGGIVTNASATTAQWIGTNSGLSRIQNDTANPMTVTVAAGTTPSGIDLDAGIILSSGGTNGTFVKAGPGTMRLTNTGNTAGITVSQGYLRVNDVSTNGVGVLGNNVNSTFTLNGGTLQYGGATDATVKPLTLAAASAVQVLDGAATLTLNGAVTGAGGLTAAGPGTLALGGSSNTYGGGTVVTGGTLLLANGSALPTGRAVTVGAGATFSTGGLSNTPATAVGTLALNGGTFKVPSGAGNYYLNQLQMAGGAIDFTGTSNFALHFTGAGAGVTVNPGVNNWIGDGTSRIQNDTTGPLTISFLGFSPLTVGTILSGGGSNPNFVLSGGTVRLSNTRNTANITASNFGILYSNDLSTDVGTGAFGTLGTGTITLAGTTFDYDGPTATSAKPLTLANYSAIGVTNGGVNLTLTGTISQSGASAALVVFGPNVGAAPSTLTLVGSNTYVGPTIVDGSGTLAVPTIADGGVISPIGMSSNAANNLQLGSSLSGRDSLLLTGTSATYSTDRGATVTGLYSDNSGGAIGVQSAGTTLTWSGPIAGSGSFIKTGPGTLVLANAGNTFGGGLYVEAGRLALGSGTAIPTGGNVTVSAGAEFNTGGLSNTAATAIGTLTLNGGTFHVPADGNYFLNQLVTTGGTVDLGGTSNVVLHLTGAGAGITSAGTGAWVNAGTARVQNDSAGPATITVAAGAFATGVDLDAPFALSNLGGTQPFVKAGPGILRLTSTANTADISLVEGYLRVDDVTSGPSGFGALGTGKISLSNNCIFVYGGPPAATAKPLTLTANAATVAVLNAGTTLNLSGPISGAAGAGFQTLGPGFIGNPATSTVALLADNTYTGPTYVIGGSVVAVPKIPDGGTAGPLGASPSAPGNLVLGYPAFLSRGDLLLTGPNAAYSTNRGAFLQGLYSYRSGGAIGVQNAGTTLTVSGQITSNAGDGSFIKAGPGTVVLTNPGNTYKGGTYVEAGTLAVGGNGAVIPAGTAVTVLAGATFDLGPYGNGPPANAVSNVSLAGGTLRATGATNSDFYTQSFAMTGGAVNFADTPFTWIHVTGAAGISTSAAATTATWIGAGTSRFLNDTFGPMPLTVAAGSAPGGIDLEAGIMFGNNGYNPTFTKLGFGTVRLTNPLNAADFVVQRGRLRVDNLAALGGGLVTLNGGTLTYGGSDAFLGKLLTLDSAGGTLEVLGAATTLTVVGPIVSNGLFTKAGPGTLVLNNLANTYDGGITVSGGRLDVAADAQLGAAAITVTPAGTLRYTASATTARTFNLAGGTLEAPAGVTLTLNGAAVNGGFLRGAGTLALAGGASLAGATAATSTTVTQTGPASVTNFTNNGQFTTAAGQTLTWGNGTNTSAGRMTVSGTANVSDFVSDGMVTVSPGGVVSNSVSDLVLGGGSRTVVGAVGAAAPARIDLGGRDLQLAGGLLVNNGGTFASGGGVRNGTVVVDYGGRAKGVGYYEDVVTQNGGVFSPGNSPGTTPVGTQRFSNGGVLNIDVNAAGPNGTPAGGSSGTDPGWSRVDVGSFLRFYPAADQHFTITLTSLTAANTTGPVFNFDATKPHTWEVVRMLSGSTFVTTATGATPADPSAYSPALVDVQTAGTFLNPLLGGTFTTSLAANGLGAGTYSVFVNFTPVPEPAAVLAACAAAAGAAGWLRRRFRLLIGNGSAVTE